MAQHACDTMHREKRTLRNAKLLLRKLRGDEVWIPTELFNAPDDNEIFDTEKVYNKIIAETRTSSFNDTAMATHSINDKSGSRTVSGSTNGEGINNVEVIATQENNPVREAAENLAPEDIDADDIVDQTMKSRSKVKMAGMTNRNEIGEAGNPHEIATGADKDQDDETVDVVASDVVVVGDPHQSSTNGFSKADKTASKVMNANNDDKDDENSKPNKSAEPDLDDMGNTGADAVPEAKANGNSHSTEPMEQEEDEDSNPAPEPRRMRTRAQAAATTSERAPSSPHTATPEPPYIPPPIHPLFLLPASAKTNADYALPPPEAEETRRMLMVYVQKQEEVCRSAEKLYQNLLRADRERRTVLSWCKAEGHVGEMSDGEDWCDKEEWGLDDDLKKGEGDEKDGDEGTVGKKTRGRRA